MKMDDASEPFDPSKRDFLFYATGGFGAVATGAAVWPLIASMNPSADVLALSSIRVDISGVAVGSQLTVEFRGKPVFIRHRTDAEIAAAQSQAVEDLPDPASRNPNAPDGSLATDAYREVQDHPEFLVMIGVCTHLGCVPLGDGAGDFGGWFCPCHGSHYDTAGRIRRGPAPENLHIPELTLLDDLTLILGESPA